jgi:hypothetical protein
VSALTLPPLSRRAPPSPPGAGEGKMPPRSTLACLRERVASLGEPGEGAVAVAQDRIGCCEVIGHLLPATTARLRRPRLHIPDLLRAQPAPAEIADGTVNGLARRSG